MGKQLQLKIISIFILCFFIYYNLTISIFANDYNANDFELDDILIEDIDKSFRNSLTISEIETTNHNIMNFDVDATGNIIICLTNNSVNIYNNSLEFLYNVDYDVNGTSIAFWYNELASIYLSKTDVIIQVDKNGAINAYKVKNSIDNSNLYNKIRGNKTIVTDNFSYELCYSSSFQKSMMVNPTKLVRVNGEIEEVVFENNNATSNILITLSLIIAFFVTIFLFVSKKIKEHKSKD